MPDEPPADWDQVVFDPDEDDDWDPIPPRWFAVVVLSLLVLIGMAALLL